MSNPTNPTGRGLYGDWEDVASEPPPNVTAYPSGLGQERDPYAVAPTPNPSLPSRPARAAANNASALHGISGPPDNAGDGVVDMERDFR